MIEKGVCMVSKACEERTPHTAQGTTAQSSKLRFMDAVAEPGLGPTAVRDEDNELLGTTTHPPHPDSRGSKDPPMRSASCTSTRLAVKISSLALGTPTSRGSRCVPPALRARGGVSRGGEGRGGEGRGC